jgi:hypothetical protein
VLAQHLSASAGFEKSDVHQLFPIATSNEGKEDCPMIKIFRFLSICAISVAFASIASAQAYTTVDLSGATFTELNGADTERLFDDGRNRVR